jgi:hypothetical protein
MTRRTVCVVFQKDEVVDVKSELMSKLNSLAQENFPGLLFLCMRHDGNDVKQQQVSSHHKTSWMYRECLLQ